jgi:hypothetical protein
MNMKKLWSGFAGLLVWSAVGFGNVQYISESRSVQASGTIWPVMSDMQSQNDIRQSTDDGTFDQTALVDLSVSENIPYFAGTTIPNWMTAYATATQNSSLTQQGISESGSLDYSTSQTYAGSEIASAESSLSVTFSLDTEYTYYLSFTGSVSSQTTSLTGVGPGLIWDDPTSPGEGVLMPGEYTLTHVFDYGPSYDNVSQAGNFGLLLNLSQISLLPAVSAPLITDTPVPEPTGILPLAAGLAFMGLGYRQRRAEFEIVRCR